MGFEEQKFETICFVSFFLFFYTLFPRESSNVAQESMCMRQLGTFMSPNIVPSLFVWIAAKKHWTNLRKLREHIFYSDNRFLLRFRNWLHDPYHRTIRGTTNTASVVSSFLLIRKCVVSSFDYRLHLTQHILTFCKCAQKRKRTSECFHVVFGAQKLKKVSTLERNKTHNFFAVRDMKKKCL